MNGVIFDAIVATIKRNGCVLAWMKVVVEGIGFGSVMIGLANLSWFGYDRVYFSTSKRFAPMLGSANKVPPVMTAYY